MPIKFYQGTAKALANRAFELENGGLAIATDEMQWYLKYNNLLKLLDKETELSPKQIQNIVQNGKATEHFNIGDQITTKWNDGTTEYIFPWDVVSFEDALQEDGTVKPAMWLQAHYALSAPREFDAPEAFYVAKDTVLPAGTYNITMPAKFRETESQGGNKTYQFELQNTVPKDGCLKLLWPSGWPPSRIVTYSSLSSKNAIEEALLSEGNEGTSLGTIDGVNLNEINRVVFGYNNYEESAIRQYLNSDANTNWWAPQHEYDYICDHTDKQGFLAGLDPEFIEILGEPVLKTAKDHIRDDLDRIVFIYSETADKIFLPSLGQLYFNSRFDEGAAWDYWKELSGQNSPLSTGTSIPTFKISPINNKELSNACLIQLRSIGEGTTFTNWCINSNGGAYLYNTRGSFDYCAPACCIC